MIKFFKNNLTAFCEMFVKIFKKDTYKGMGFVDYFLLLISIAYPTLYFGIFIKFMEGAYLWIVLTVLLIAFPTAAFYWFKNGNKGK
jgi:hypothetical protein